MNFTAWEHDHIHFCLPTGIEFVSTDENKTSRKYFQNIDFDFKELDSYWPTQNNRQFLRACFPTARSTDRTLGRTVLFGRCDSPWAPKPKNAQAVDPLRMWFYSFTDRMQDK